MKATRRDPHGVPRKERRVLQLEVAWMYAEEIVRVEGVPVDERGRQGGPWKEGRRVVDCRKEEVRFSFLPFLFF